MIPKRFQNDKELYSLVLHKKNMINKDLFFTDINLNTKLMSVIYRSLYTRLNTSTVAFFNRNFLFFLNMADDWIDNNDNNNNNNCKCSLR